MSAHPSTMDLASLADGSLPAADARLVEKHLEECAVCARIHGASRQVIALMQDPPTFQPDFAAVAPRPARWPVAVAMVCALGLATIVTWRPDGMVARGPASPLAYRAHVSVEQDGKTTSLHDGAHVKPAPMTASATLELTESVPGRFFGIFLRDAHANVHWLWPAWPDAAEVPSLVSVDKAGVHAVPFALSLPAPPPGALEGGLVVAQAPCALDALDAALARRDMPACALRVITWSAIVDGARP